MSSEEIICAKMVRHALSLVAVALNQPSDVVELHRLLALAPTATIDQIPERYKSDLEQFIGTFNQQKSHVQDLISHIEAAQLSTHYVLQVLQDLRKLERKLKKLERAESFSDVLRTTQSVRNRIQRILDASNDILRTVSELKERSPVAHPEHPEAQRSLKQSDAEELFRILLISDLHWRLEKSENHWRDFERPFLNDLIPLIQPPHHLDLVLCAGDLAFSGLKTELTEGVNPIFKKLWETFGINGSHPFFLTVPGNHDVRWCDDDLGQNVLKRLQDFFDKEDIQNSVWNKPASQESDLIRRSFQEWNEWKNDNLKWQYHERKEGGLLKEGYCEGKLPGDFSCYLCKPNGRLGILGLNSAFLQLDGGDYEGRLALDSRQFHESVPERKGQEWLEDNDANIVVTHHPLSWLHSSCQDHVLNKLLIAGLIDIHVHGHLHTPKYEGSSRQPGELVHSIQSIALFGDQEYFDRKLNKKINQLQGYVLIELSVGPSANSFRFCPRQMLKDLRWVSPIDIAVNSDGWTERVTIPKKTTRRGSRARST